MAANHTAEDVSCSLAGAGTAGGGGRGVRGGSAALVGDNDGGGVGGVSGVSGVSGSAAPALVKASEKALAKESGAARFVIVSIERARENETRPEKK